MDQVSEHFKRVAENSSIAPPGPTTSAYTEAKAPADSISVGASKNFNQCLLELAHPILISRKIHSPVVPSISEGCEHPSANQAHRGSYE